jgi:hypothetical protein
MAEKKDIHWHSIVGYVVNNITRTLEKHNVFWEEAKYYYGCVPYWKTLMGTNKRFLLDESEFHRYKHYPDSSDKIIGKLKGAVFGDENAFPIYEHETVVSKHGWVHDPLVLTEEQPDDFKHYYVKDGYRVFIWYDEDENAIEDFLEAPVKETVKKNCFGCKKQIEEGEDVVFMSKSDWSHNETDEKAHFCEQCFLLKLPMHLCAVQDDLLHHPAMHFVPKEYQMNVINDSAKMMRLKNLAGKDFHDSFMKKLDKYSKK